MHPIWGQSRSARERRVPVGLETIIRCINESLTIVRIPGSPRETNPRFSPQVAGIADVYDCAPDRARPYVRRLPLSGVAQMAAAAGFCQRPWYGALRRVAGQVPADQAAIRSGGRLTLDPIQSC